MKAEEDTAIMMKQAHENMTQLMEGKLKTEQERAELQAALDKEAQDKCVSIS